MNYIPAKNRILLIKVLKDACDLCGCCVGVCPEDAIELTTSELLIIPRRCSNCSKCVWCCPVEALIFDKEGAEG